MLTESQLKIFSIIADGQDDVKAIAESAGICLSQTYRVIGSLRKMGLVSEDRIEVERIPVVAELASMMQEYQQLYSPLSGNGLEILATLTEPMSVPEICEAGGFELSRTYTKIKELWSRSLVYKRGHKYAANTRLWIGLEPLLYEYRKFKILSDTRIPAAAKVYRYTKRDTIFSCKNKVDCEPTAFSVYDSYGIEIFTRNYYRTSPTVPTMEEVFLHSLYVISKEDNWRLKMFTLIFYCKYRDQLTLPDMEISDEILAVLDNQRVKGWVPLWEMQERADMYGVKLR